MYFGCSAWGYLWEKEDAAGAGSPLWHQAAAVDQVMGFIFFPLFQEKKKSSKPNLFVGNSSKTFPDSRKSALEKKVSSFFRQEAKALER